MATNEILECLGRYSKSNLPMLILDIMRCTVNEIWNLSERKLRIELDANFTKISELVVLAQDNKYDAILLRKVEQFTEDQQKHLAIVLSKMRSAERGKFILTTDHFDRLTEELLEEFCSVKEPFIKLPEHRAGVTSVNRKNYENY